MPDYPDFMKNSANRIPASDQNTPDVEGYVFDGADAQHTQMAFWTCKADRVSGEHVHPFDEWIVVVEGEFTLTTGEGTRILRKGDEACIPAGTVQSGSCKAGTRTIHAFGGRRAERLKG